MEKMKLNRRTFLQFSAITAAGAILASCAPTAAPTTEGPGTEPTTAPSSDEAITIRMWHWDNFLAEGMQPVADKFKEEHPNITIAIEMTNYGEYSQKVAATIAGGTPPDVAGTIAEHFTNMAGQGQLIDLKPYIDSSNFSIDDYHPGNLSQNSWNSILLSIPYTADGMWWFYQPDMFTEKGLKTPYEYWKEGNWTWDIATQLANDLTTGEGVDRVFGYGGLGYGNYFEILPYLASNGTALFDDEYTKCLLDDPKAIELYQWGYDMRAYSPGPDDAQSSTPQSGRVAQWLDWSVFGQVYAPNMNFKYSYAPPPASPTTKNHVYCGDAPGFGILKGVKHPDESWLWIERINEPDAIETVFQFTGTEPPRISMATDPELWARNEKYNESAIGYELTVDRIEGAFYNTPKVSNFVEMWQAHNEELSLVWTDAQPLQEALTNATGRINELLKEADIDHDKLYWTG
jgi:multiple sugar transport system substrate-binding protein